LETLTVSLKDLPSVDRVLRSEGGQHLCAQYGRTLVLQALRTTLEQARTRIRDGDPPPAQATLLADAETTLRAWLAPTLRPVINATGVIIHTNLGRAPLSQSAQAAMLAAADGYSTLEYDLGRGTRGKRERHAEHLLHQLTGAEAALVVNNNAAAVLLGLTALAKHKEVVVSRSQLIEIGGGFRIPDVMRQSGAKIREVGTTNRTHLHDYENAIHANTALILHAHHSNFKLVGYVTEPPVHELIELGHRHELPVLEDLGSGALLDTANFGLGHEPMVQEMLHAGAPLVMFSGDKLLGGPQAGIILGETKLVERLQEHPLARALRPDKLCLAALTATLNHYLREEAVDHIPVWQMIARSGESLHARATQWQKALQRGEVIAGRSTVGGGSLPEETLPTWLLALDLEHPDAFARTLRQRDPPIIARIADDRVLFDPRTVLQHQEEPFLETLRLALEAS
jgi:L-seryl-tRNA(Ser) seleniumtransferase